MANNIYHVTYGDIGTGLVINDGVAVPANKDKIEVSPDYLKRTGDTATDLKVTKVASDARDVLALEDGREIFEPKQPPLIIGQCLFLVGEFDKRTQAPFAISLQHTPHTKNYPKVIEWDGTNCYSGGLLDSRLPSTSALSYAIPSKTDENIIQIWAGAETNQSTCPWELYNISGTMPTFKTVDEAYFKDSSNYYKLDHKNNLGMSSNNMTPSQIAFFKTNIIDAASMDVNRKVVIPKADVAGRTTYLVRDNNNYVRFNANGTVNHKGTRFIVTQDTTNFYAWDTIAGYNWFNYVGITTATLVSETLTSSPTISTVTTDNLGQITAISPNDLSVATYCKFFLRILKGSITSGAVDRVLYFTANRECSTYGITQHLEMNLRCFTSGGTSYICSGTAKDINFRSGGEISKIFGVVSNQDYLSKIDGLPTVYELFTQVDEQIPTITKFKDNNAGLELLTNYYDNLVFGDPVPQAVLDAYRVRPVAGSTALSSEIISNVGGSYSAYSDGLTEYKDSVAQLGYPLGGTAPLMASVTRDGNYCMVTIDGGSYGGSGSSPNAIIFTIPAGYRPKGSMTAIGCATTAMVDVPLQITSNGDIISIKNITNLAGFYVTFAYPAEK